MKSWFLTFRVESRRWEALMTAPGPTTIPFGLMSAHALLLMLSVPKIIEGSPPVTRFKSAAPLKFSASLLSIPKLSQWITLGVMTLMVVPLGITPPGRPPATFPISTVPPDGIAQAVPLSAKAMPSESSDFFHIFFFMRLPPSCCSPLRVLTLCSHLSSFFSYP